MTGGTDLPAEFMLVWAVWLVGGVGLMIWFLRRSGGPRRPSERTRPLGQTPDSR